MLSELHIRDFAIIRDLTLTFERGLMVFTGETGAGKSIMIDAVELLLGGRAESTVVRTGADTAMLEARFKLSGAVAPAIRELLAREQLLDSETDDEVLVGREIRVEGRNVCRVNGRVVSLALLRQIGDLLVDVHGQSEHLSLLRVQHHLTLLDRFAGLEADVAEYQREYDSLRGAMGELHALRQRERETAQRADFLAYQVDEINTAKLDPAEAQELQSERVRLANAEALTESAQAAIAALEAGLQDDLSAADLLGQAVESIESLAALDDSLAPLRSEALALQEQASDLAGRLREYTEGVEHEPDRLRQVEARLAAIDGLKRKYGSTVEEVLAFAAQAQSELDGLTNAEARVEELTELVESLKALLATHAGKLSAVRQQAAVELAAAVEAELEQLHMAGAEFEVSMQRRSDPEGLQLPEGEPLAYDRRGVDQVEFLVAPNPGEGLKPMVKVASGGETSRLMLGLKTVLAEADEMPTLIFDEIDQGIGGRVGAVVGAKLWGLSHGHQVLCITHLPQLAAYGDRHFRVEKQVVEGRTETRVVALDAGERVTEMATMLGGASDPNVESAQALLGTAERDKVPVEA